MKNKTKVYIFLFVLLFFLTIILSIFISRSFQEITEMEYTGLVDNMCSIKINGSYSRINRSSWFPTTSKGNPYSIGITIPVTDESGYLNILSIQIQSRSGHVIVLPPKPKEKATFIPQENGYYCTAHYDNIILAESEYSFTIQYEYCNASKDPAKKRSLCFTSLKITTIRWSNMILDAMMSA